MAYLHYMTDPLAIGINEFFTVKHVPFKVFARIVPANDGRRFTKVRDSEKIASFIESDLQEAGFNIAIPVAYTPQMGQNPARVTIVGMLAVYRSEHPILPPTTDSTVIHSGTVPGEKTAKVTGPMGGSLSWGQEPIDEINDGVKWLKENLEAASSHLNDIYRIEYSGVRFGEEFKSFP